MAEALWIVAGTIGGLIAGSFLSTLAIRWPSGLKVDGRSRCDGCGVQLRAAQLLPILAYVRQGGRCAGCGARIDRRHILLESLAVLIGIVATAASPGPAGFAGAFFGWLLLILATLDLTDFWLPDRLTLPLAAAGLLAGAAGLAPTLVDRGAGMVFGWASLQLVASGYRWLRGRDGLGRGDPKLFGAIGAWLGWQMLPIVLLFASLMGLAAVLVARMIGRPIGRHDALPFGAPLAAAAWPVWLVLALWTPA